MRQTREDEARTTDDLAQRSLASQARERIAEERANEATEAAAFERKSRRNRKIGLYAAAGGIVAVALGAVPFVMRATAGEDLNALFGDTQEQQVVTVNGDETEQSVMMAEAATGQTYTIGDSFAWDSDGDGTAETYRIVRVYATEGGDEMAAYLAEHPDTPARMGEKAGFAIDRVEDEEDWTSEDDEVIMTAQTAEDTPAPPPAISPVYMTSELFFEGDDPCVYVSGENGRVLMVEYSSARHPEFATRERVSWGGNTWHISAATADATTYEPESASTNKQEGGSDEQAQQGGDQGGTGQQGQGQGQSGADQGQAEGDGSSETQLADLPSPLIEGSVITDPSYKRFFDDYAPVASFQKGCGEISVQVLNPSMGGKARYADGDVVDTGTQYDVYVRPNDFAKQESRLGFVATVVIDVKESEQFAAFHESYEIACSRRPLSISVSEAKAIDAGSGYATYELAADVSQIGKTFSFNPQVSVTEDPSRPCSATPAGLVCKSSDEKVATVSPSGEVTIKGAGNAEITITNEGDQVYEQAITSVGVTVNKLTPEYVIGSKSYAADTSMLKHVGNWHAVLNVPTKYGNVTAKTSDKKVAEPEVKKNGNANDVILHCHKAGKITLTLDIAGNATYAKKTYKIDVTIKPKEKTYYLVNGQKKNSDFSVAEHLGYTIKVCDVDPVYGKASISSADKSIAEGVIDKDNHVSIKFKKAGTTTLTLKINGTATYEAKSFKITTTVKKYSSYYVISGKKLTANATIEKVDDKTWPICDIPSEYGKASASSSDKSVANAWIGDNRRLYVHLYKEGKATVTLKIDGNAKYNGRTVKFYMVSKKQHTKLELSYSQRGVVGKSMQIGGKVIKGDAALKEQKKFDLKKWSNGVVYSSNNTNVATIDKNGKISFKNPGVVKITVKANGDKAYYSYTQTVSIPVKKSQGIYPSSQYYVSKAPDLGMSYFSTVKNPVWHPSGKTSYYYQYVKGNDVLLAASYDTLEVSLTPGGGAVSASAKWDDPKKQNSPFGYDVGIYEWGTTNFKSDTSGAYFRDNEFRTLTADGRKIVPENRKPNNKDYTSTLWGGVYYGPDTNHKRISGKLRLATIHTSRITQDCTAKITVRLAETKTHWAASRTFNVTFRRIRMRLQANNMTIKKGASQNVNVQVSETTPNDWITWNRKDSVTAHGYTGPKNQQYGYDAAYAHKGITGLEGTGANMFSLDYKMTYKSSDTSVATVDSKGNVTGKKKGTAKITLSIKLSDQGRNSYSTGMDCCPIDRNITVTVK